MKLARSISILIIHDDRDIVNAFREIFAAEPEFLPFYAVTVGEALKIALTQKPRCAIIGKKIDHFTGNELIKILNELLPEIPIIMIMNKENSRRTPSTRLTKDKHISYILKHPLKKQEILKSIRTVLKQSAQAEKEETDADYSLLSPFQTDEKLIIIRAALEILHHDTKDLFIRILSILSEMPDSDSTSILNDYLNDLFDCITESIGSMSVQKRIESVIDVINAIKLGKDKFPLPTLNRIELEYSPRKLLFIETSRLIKHALMNLIDNALTYSAQHDKVHIRIIRKDEEIIVTVTDHGPGIPNKNRHKILRRHFQSPISKTTKGSGNGIWIAYNILNEENAKLLIKDNPRGGTIVTITIPVFNLKKSGLGLQQLSDWFKLPLEVIEKKARIIKTILLLEYPAYEQQIDSLAFANLVDHLRDERRKKERQKYFIKLQRYTQFNPEGTSVLLVDDSLYIHYTVAPILVDQGFRIVDFAFNGVEAFNLYSIFAPELIIMDITMPVKSGIETAKEIYQRNPKAKIIFITALGEYRPLINNIEQLFQDKPHRVLPKPIRPQILIEMLHSLFNQI
jgi:two-component system chemotaxis response regulator CheY